MIEGRLDERRDVLSFLASNAENLPQGLICPSYHRVVVVLDHGPLFGRSSNNVRLFVADFL